MARDNRLLGSFLLDGIPPAPRGVPKIEVAFDIDANGILNVAAKDTATGKERSIKITNSSGLSKSEVERMRHDAESHADEDKKKREAVDTRNMADSVVYRTERFLKENEKTIPEKERTRLGAIIDRLKAAMDREDVPGMKSAMEELDKASQDVGKTLYESAAKQHGGGGEPGSARRGTPEEGAAESEEKIVDADYEVKE
jgi:molecular chaperone DnaK